VSTFSGEVSYMEYEEKESRRGANLVRDERGREEARGDDSELWGER